MPKKTLKEILLKRNTVHNRQTPASIQSWKSVNFGLKLSKTRVQQPHPNRDANPRGPHNP